MFVIKKYNQYLNEDLLGKFNNIELYVNPKTIKNMNEVRAISSNKGNLYVASEITHKELGLYLGYIGKLRLNINIYKEIENGNFVSWLGLYDKFWLSISTLDIYEKLKNDKEYINKINNIISNTIEKNPQFKYYFSYDDVVEGNKIK